MTGTLHFKSPDQEDRTLCGRQLSKVEWTTDGDKFNPVMLHEMYEKGLYPGRCGNCRRGLRWVVRPSGKGLTLGCPPEKEGDES